MSEKLVGLTLTAAYMPLVAMLLLWLAALALRLAGRPGLAHWLKVRTSVPTPEQNPPAEAREGPQA